jgi:hypothetical protein
LQATNIYWALTLGQALFQALESPGVKMPAITTTWTILSSVQNVQRRTFIMDLTEWVIHRRINSSWLLKRRQRTFWLLLYHFIETTHM